MRNPNLPWRDSCLTPVPPQETPVEPKASPLPDVLPTRVITLCDTFRHSGWAADRLRVAVALVAARVPETRIDRFAACGGSYWVMRNTDDPDLFKVAPDYCHDRFCIPCGLLRQTTIRRNLHDRLRDAPHRFITLTVRHHDEGLAFLIKHLYDSFRRLRQRRLWKRFVFGGAAFLEIDWNAESRSWHPHLHIMAEGNYFDVMDLKQLWLGVTGDSTHVDIKLIRRKSDVVRYVTKYATKPLPPDVLRDNHHLTEAVCAIHGTRMILCFGTWKAWRLLDLPSEESWELFDHFTDVKIHALDGDTLCQSIVAMLRTADPKTGEFIALDSGPPPDD